VKTIRLSVYVWVVFLFGCAAATAQSGNCSGMSLGPITASTVFTCNPWSIPIFTGTQYTDSWTWGQITCTNSDTDVVYATLTLTATGTGGCTGGFNCAPWIANGGGVTLADSYPGTNSASISVQNALLYGINIKGFGLFSCELGSIATFTVTCQAQPCACEQGSVAPPDMPGDPQKVASQALAACHKTDGAPTKMGTADAAELRVPGATRSPSGRVGAVYASD
jgi:hypothetical protein